MEKQKVFVICPVRGIPDAHRQLLDDVVSGLRRKYTVYFPHEDTNQIDPSGGYRICCDNRKAIADADVIAVVWDGKSQGCLFDMGIAFALSKPILFYPTLLPICDNDGKSFRKVLSKWAEVR